MISLETGMIYSTALISLVSYHFGKTQWKLEVERNSSNLIYICNDHEDSSSYMCVFGIERQSLNQGKRGPLQDFFGKKLTLLNQKIFWRCGMKNIDKSTGQEKLQNKMCLLSARFNYSATFIRVLSVMCMNINEVRSDTQPHRTTLKETC